MIKTINFSQFCDEFNGSQYENNFTYEGKQALFDYIEGMDEATGAAIECDIIAFCCEYTEYNSALEAAQDHGYEESVDLKPHKNVDLEEVAQLENAQALEWLEEKTTVIKCENGHVIIAQF